MKIYQYDVALSFAGEDRGFAKDICVALKREGIKVFYDEDEDVNLWGKDLPTKLKEVYHDDSQYCIIILSDSYVNKKWPRLELQHAIKRLVEQKGEDYILPVHLDGFSDEVSGMPDTIGYISAESINPRKVVNKFLQKIRERKQKDKQIREFKVAPPHGPLRLTGDTLKRVKELSKVAPPHGPLRLTGDTLKRVKELSKVTSLHSHS